MKRIDSLRGFQCLVLMILFVCTASGRAEPYLVITQNDPLNVREHPSTISSRLGTLPAGETIEIDDVDPDAVWGHAVDLSFELPDGYVCMTYVTLQGYDLGEYTNSSGGRVWIRSLPEGRKLKKLPSRGVVQVSRWLMYNDSVWAVVPGGYILGSCLEKSPE